jgi:hypothetical protein
MAKTFIANGQGAIRPINELLDEKDSAWKLIQGWIKSATNKIEILPVDAVRAKDALYKTQVTTHSPMGAIVYMTGGLLIDDGWIRILGSGSVRLRRTLPDWNNGKSIKELGKKTSNLLIADDAIGGFFSLNGGLLGKDAGKVYYLSPDNLEYEPLNITYTEFLLFCFNGDLEKFYEGKRWTTWRSDASKLSGDKVFNFYPFLWTKEGKDINKNSRKEISIEEQYDLNIEMRKQLGFD